MQERKYFDKNGTEILEGMTVLCEDGTTEYIHKSDDGELGVNATNPNWAGSRFSIELYPLYQFNTRLWEVIK